MTDEERVTFERLYWFYKMVATGGPDGSDLDFAVMDDARDAAVIAERILFSADADDLDSLADDWIGPL